MSSPARSAREEERRLSIRTIAIASISSATAAIITSRFWAGGTPIAAAVTPVIVAILSEVLHRPTAVIAERLTTDRSALLSDAMGAGSPSARKPPPSPARDLEAEHPAAEERPPPLHPTDGEAVPSSERPGPVSYHRAPQPRQRIALRVVALTAILAFAVSAAILTLPELISGQSIGRSNRHTTLFGGKKHSPAKTDQSTTPATTPATTPETDQQTTPKPAPKQQQRQPTTTTPTTTQTTPRSPP
jgi:hypothetical protein